MRCPQCGNENPETHRFCGMCGASLLQGPGAAMAAPGNSVPASATPASGSAPRAAAPTATATAPRPAAPQPASPPVAPRAATAEPTPSTPRATVAPPEARQRISEEEPIISGPSFLGLNQPAPSSTRRGSLSIDPSHAPSSRNLNYLLEDDEPKSGGGWKVLLVLIALALAVGFGYLRWKNGGLPFLNPTPKPSAQSPAITEVPANSDVSSNPSANPASSPPANAAPPTTTQNSNPTTAPATNAPATGSGNQAAPNGSAAANSSSSNSAADNTRSNGGPAVTPATPSGSAANPSAAATAPRGGSSGSASVNPASQTQTSAGRNSDDSNSASSDNEAADDDAAAPAAAAKPAAAIKRVDPVAEAQKYLYGKGAAQDCDRGLRLLKPSANSGNAKAMIEMGALYSAGLCTPRDLPTAYRWFAMALRKDPDNQSVATDLQKLWGEMTQPERQLAIRLSQ